MENHSGFYCSHSMGNDSESFRESGRDRSPLMPNTSGDAATAFLPEEEGVARGVERVASTTVQKLDWRVLPYACAIVMLSYLDRGNLGFVAADVCTELHLNHTRYGIGVGLFGLGYVLSQIPSNWLIRRWGARTWFTLMLASWGTVAAMFGVVQTRYEFYLLRFLLGIAEGGTFPGVWYFLTLFYPDAHLTYPFAIIEGAIAVSSPLSSPLAAGILSLEGVLGLAGWRMLFVVEGVMPIVFGCFLYFTLPSTPEQASYLTTEEKEWIAMHQERSAMEEERHLWCELKAVIQKKAFWILIFANLCRGMLLTAAFYWMTLIIDDMLHGDDDDDDDEDSCAASKSTDVASVGLTAVPFTICAIFSFIFGRLAAGVRNRPRVAGSTIAVSGVFLVGWVAFRHLSFVVALLSLSLGISCFLVPNALLVALVASYFDQETKATSIALYNTIGGVGMTIGPILVGILVDNEGYGVVVTVLAFIALAAGIALLAAKDPLLDTKSSSTSRF